MKTMILATALVLTASAAHASSVTCSTNVSGNPGNPETTITIRQQGSSLVATSQSNGGRAMFVTAPVSFPVQAQSYGPEVVEYSNAQSGFMLEVGYQPMNGHIYGTMTTESEGRRFQQSVICSAGE